LPATGDGVKVLNMKLLLGSLVSALLWLPMAAERATVETYEINGPTILAFFQPVTDAELAKDADTNEVLGDFQLYASRAGPKLEKAGIDFNVVSAVKFRTRSGTVVRTFSSGKIGVGYYFIQSGKQPLVRYGVMTDDEIFEVAGKYFNMKIGN
jgi:hypothetical protein